MPGSTTRPAAQGPVVLVSPLGATTQSVQRDSSVAMDAEGDFVVTWQSQNQSTGGYQIYAQAYNSSGQPLGGTDAVQDINFINGFAGTFELSWTTGDSSTNPVLTSGPIAINGNAAASVAAVKNALTAMGADVNVTATSLTSLEIDFVGASGSLPQTQLWVAPGSLVPNAGVAGNAGVSVVTAVAGKSGEFLANSATQSNCVQPDVAMDAKGDFVVTWSAYGTYLDNPTQGNIFAVRYSYNSSVMQPVVVPTPVSTSNDGSEIQPERRGRQQSGQPHRGGHFRLRRRGAGLRHRGRQRLLGKLLAAGGHRLGAQRRPRGLERYDRGRDPAADVTVAFDLPSGRVIVPVTEVVVNPAYNGNAEAGNDLSLLELQYVPVGVTGFQLYTGSNEIGQVAELFGYGATGTGVTGDSNPNAANVMHTGANMFQSTGATLGYSDTMLGMDFEERRGQHDAYQVLYGISFPNSFLGANEAVPGHGDSGGPWLLDINPNVPGSGLIAGVVSFGYGVPGVMLGNNPYASTFGSFAVSTRVSSFAGWIDSVVGAPTPVPFEVNFDDPIGQATNAQGQALVRQQREPDQQRHRQRVRQPVASAGGDGPGGRLRHYLDVLRPRRSLRGRQRRLRPAFQLQRHPGQRGLPGQPDHGRQSAE